MSTTAMPAGNEDDRGGTSGVTICEVFRSPRREGLYLYVKREDGLSRVPEALLERFGTPESALIFRLSAQRRLAQADAAMVLDALAEPGYYLQMPPAEHNPAPEPEADAGPDSA